MPCSDIDYSLPETFGSTSRVSFGEGGGEHLPPLALAVHVYAENSILHVNQFKPL